MALTKGLKENQKAITQGFSQFERLADMKELPQIEEDNQEQSGTDQSKKTPITYNLEKNFEKNELDYLSNFDYPRPNNFIDVNPRTLEDIYEQVNNEKTSNG